MLRSTVSIGTTRNIVLPEIRRHASRFGLAFCPERTVEGRAIPEYADAAKKGYGPEVILGSESRRAGRMLVQMTGGTEGPKESLDRLRDAGVDTLVDMHFSEDFRKHAEELHMNLVIAGHVSSDTLGMNLVLDRIEPHGVHVRCVSGMVRVSRA